MANITLEDIARQAGVSRSTVSRVINDQPYVSEAARNSVMEVVHQTGYIPNAAARTLASQRSLTIGLVLPQSVSSFFADPYYSQLTQGIAQSCNQNNYTLALFLVETKDDEEKILPRVSRRGLLDGVIVQASHHGDRMMTELINSSIPLVFAGRPFQADHFSYIDIDNVKASYIAVNHLIRLGRKRIATITGPPQSTVGIDRKAGYVKALKNRGLDLDKSLIVEGDFTEVGGYYAMQQLLPMKPDAVFAVSDIMACGAMRAVKHANLRIPQDIAFIGFDDIPLPNTPEPSLTTIRQPVVKFGVTAVELLIDLIENGTEPPRRIILETELIIRESCGASYRGLDHPL